MPPAGPEATQNTPLAPSVEKAYYRKCIELKRRLNEVEEANDAARLRKLRLNRAIMKMRLERAFLLDQLAKRMELDDDENSSNNNNNNNNNNNGSSNSNSNSKPQDAREGSASQTATLSRYATWSTQPQFVPEHGNIGVPTVYGAMMPAPSSGPALHPAFDAGQVPASYDPMPTPLTGYSASVPTRPLPYLPHTRWTCNEHFLSEEMQTQPTQPMLPPTYMTLDQHPVDQPLYSSQHEPYQMVHPVYPNQILPSQNVTFLHNVEGQLPITQHSSGQKGSRFKLPK